jgi:hypothetical protein
VVITEMGLLPVTVNVLAYYAFEFAQLPFELPEGRFK